MDKRPAGDSEGYLKFTLSWDKKPIDLPVSLYQRLEQWRDRLYQVGAIGAYPDGIGFGNISCRAPGLTHERSKDVVQFYITGSATGNYQHLSPEHYALVTDYSLARNTLECRGMTKASSESLSHAAIYEAEPVADAVIHVHHHELWESFRGELPTTAESAEYGTPEMAFSLQELAVRATDTEGRVIVMGGHEDGVVAFGRTLDEAGNSILALLERIGER